MNTETSQPCALVTYDKESSTYHHVVDESSPSIFPYALISPVDTNLTMSSSLSTTMSSSAPSPFTYLISPTSRPSVP
jgi:hypothetical protein